MIKMINSIYGYRNANGVLETKDGNSAPFSCSKAEEARLVKSGVAEYVQVTPATPKAPATPAPAPKAPAPKGKGKAKEPAQDEPAPEETDENVFAQKDTVIK